MWQHMSHHTSVHAGRCVAVSWMAYSWHRRARHANPRLTRLSRMIYTHQSSCFCHWINGNIFTQLVSYYTLSYVHVISLLLPSLFPFFSFNHLLLLHNNCFPPSLTLYFTSHTLYLHYLITFPLSLFHCHPVVLRCPLPSILPALFHQGSPNGVGQIRPAGRRLTSCTGANWSAR